MPKSGYCPYCHKIKKSSARFNFYNINSNKQHNSSERKYVGTFVMIIRLFIFLQRITLGNPVGVLLQDNRNTVEIIVFRKVDFYSSNVEVSLSEICLIFKSVFVIRKIVIASDEPVLNHITRNNRKGYKLMPILLSKIILF